jgi:hypothetical protein
MNLKDRFPDMTPLSSPPVLFTMDGVGTTVYGHRDYDTKTQTYVKTMYFCVVFIPVVALRAYRVADAENGWYSWGGCRCRRRRVLGLGGVGQLLGRAAGGTRGRRAQVAAGGRRPRGAAALDALTPFLGGRPC